MGGYGDNKYGRDPEKALIEIKDHAESLCIDIEMKYKSDWQYKFILHAQKKRAPIETNHSKNNNWENYRNFKV